MGIETDMHTGRISCDPKDKLYKERPKITENGQKLGRDRE